MTSSVQISLLSTQGDNNADLLYWVVGMATEITCSEPSKILYTGRLLLCILRVKFNMEHAAFGSA